MSASWVIVRRATGEAVLEIFSKRVADAANRKRYDVVPILEYLQNLNASVRAARNK